MKHYQEKRPVRKVYHGFRRVLYSWPTVIVFGLLVLLMGRSVYRVYTKWDRSRGELSEERAKYEQETERQAYLQSEVEKLKTARGWEEAVRQNYGLAKPGEGVIIIVDKSATGTR